MFFVLIKNLTQTAVIDILHGGSVAEWFRSLVLSSGDPGFKASTLPPEEFVSR